MASCAIVSRASSRSSPSGIPHSPRRIPSSSYQTSSTWSKSTTSRTSAIRARLRRTPVRTTSARSRMGLALLLGTSSAFHVIACGGAVDLSSATTDGGANDGTFTGDDAAWDDAASHGLSDAGKADAFHLDGGGAPVDAGTVCSTPCPGGCLIGGRCLATLASGQARPGRIAVNGRRLLGQCRRSR